MLGNLRMHWPIRIQSPYSHERMPGAGCRVLASPGDHVEQDPSLHFILRDDARPFFVGVGQSIDAKGIQRRATGSAGILTWRADCCQAVTTAWFATGT